MKPQIINIHSTDIWEVVNHYKNIQDIQALEALTMIFIDYSPIGEEIGQVWLETKDKESKQ